MDQNQDDKEWQEIKRALFPPYQHPNPDLFVSKVMRLVEEEATTASKGLFRWSWRVPALALGVLTGFFLVLGQPKMESVTTESLLLGEESSVSTQTDELLELVSEEI